MKKITVKVQRKNPGTEETSFQTFEVPYEKGMRVLDALKWIQKNRDGTLAFRWNCGKGICGSCAMEINGKPSLACLTETKPGITPLRITSLKVSSNVKDLVHENEKFELKEKTLRPWFHGEEMGREGYRMKYNEAEPARQMRRCIECNICNASCRPTRDDVLTFPGPRAIVKARAWDKHPKDFGNREEELRRKGLFNCNVTRCCQINCPQDISITDEAILPAQEEWMRKERSNNDG